MSSTTPPGAQPSKKGRKPDKSEVMADSTQAINEELKSKLLDVQVELQQERAKVSASEPGKKIKQEETQHQ